MRSSFVPSALAALAWCLLAPLAGAAQTPTPGGLQPVAPRPVEEAPAREPAPEPEPQAPEAEVVFRANGVFEPVKPKAPEAPAGGIDSASMITVITNSVINAGGGGFDATLGGMSTGKPEIDRYVLESSKRYGVDPKLVIAVMHQESGFKQRAVSPKGASGYMQLMPGTARRFGVTDIFDPRQNIDAGTKYLRFLLDLFENDVALALAGYNAGEYRVIRNNYRVPNIRETQNYVKVITSRYFARAGRRYAVTFGASPLQREAREQIQRAALVSVDDRGTESLTNVY